MPRNPNPKKNLDRDQKLVIALDCSQRPTVMAIFPESYGTSYLGDMRSQQKLSSAFGANFWKNQATVLILTIEKS